MADPLLHHHTSRRSCTLLLGIIQASSTATQSEEERTLPTTIATRRCHMGQGSQDLRFENPHAADAHAVDRTYCGSVQHIQRFQFWPVIWLAFFALAMLILS